MKNLSLSQDETKVPGAVPVGVFWKMSICCDPVGVFGVAIISGQGWFQCHPDREDFHLWKMVSFYTGSRSKAFYFLSLSLSKNK